MRIFGILAIALMFIAAWFSVRLARADAAFREGSPESVAGAVAMEPTNTEYLEFRALQLDYEGARNSVAMLERAAELNPLSSTPRIRLGLDAEVRGDFAGAEKWLTEATSIDRQFEPRWTLANFYFRHGNAEEFWKWIRSSLEISYGDRRPAFDLCWRMSGDAGEILTRAIPERHEVVAAYLEYLLQTKRVEAARQVAMMLAQPKDAGDRALLFAADDALIDGRDGSGARELWRAMGFAEPHGVFHGDFAGEDLGHGFDWRLIDSAGVVHMKIEQPRSAHRISLNGNQPESCELLRQFVSLTPGGHYVLRWQARTSGLGSPTGPRSLTGPGSPTGIAWRIGDLHAPIASSEEGRAGEAGFVAPGALVPLSLVYQRPSGQVRAEGLVELWDVAIEPR